jgi:hypothetical protein
MADFNVRADAVNVEQMMEQIRARIREKRGVDYTEQQIRELATVKLEKFLDPRGVRSDLLEQFRRVQPPYAPPELPNYAFEDQTLFESHRGALRWIRRLLQPVLKLFFNPNPLIQALHIQSRLNTLNAEREARRESARHGMDQLHYEVLHNLVVEATRMGIEVKNLKMRVESFASRLEFTERRARALESVVVYKPSPEDRREVRPAIATERPAEREREAAPQPTGARAMGAPVAGTPASVTPALGTAPEGPGQRSRKRRRRRGRRGAGAATVMMGGAPGQPAPAGGVVDEAGHAEGGEETGDAGDTQVDQRDARPGPVEPAFGADAQAAERTSADPVDPKPSDPEQ